MPPSRGLFTFSAKKLRSSKLFRTSCVLRNDHYVELGISRTATQEEVKKAYRKAALDHHPDRFPDPEKKKVAEERFKKISSAYTVLSDKDKRAQYDRFGNTDGTGFNASSVDPDELFASVCAFYNSLFVVVHPCV